MSLKFDFSVDRGGFKLHAAHQVPARGVTALFGRSGAGKTTLLRCIAGLERHPGELTFKGDVWQRGRQFLPTWKRPLGYVFQEASLFPHLRVRGNLEYGYRRVAPQKRRLHCDEIIALLRLEELLQHWPYQLSGGQRQRVAMGRALLTSPELLLMDEPLASLDAASKEEILPFLERLHDALDMPIVYVSHSIDEVIRLADHMVLIDDGQVVAQGSMQALLISRELPFVKTESASAALTARVVLADAGDQLSELELDDGQRLLISRPPTPIQVGQALRLRILARDVGLALRPPEDTSILNCLRVTLLDSQPGVVPSQLLVRLALGRQVLLSRISCRSAGQLGLYPGQPLHALVKTVALG